MSTDVRPDDVQDEDEGDGMGVAAVAVLSTLAVIGALVWLSVFHHAGQGRWGW